MKTNHVIILKRIMRCLLPIFIWLLTFVPEIQHKISLSILWLSGCVLLFFCSEQKDPHADDDFYFIRGFEFSVIFGILSLTSLLSGFAIWPSIENNESGGRVILSIYGLSLLLFLSLSIISLVRALKKGMVLKSDRFPSP